MSLYTSYCLVLKLHIFNFANDVCFQIDRNILCNNCIVASILTWTHFSLIKRTICCAWQIEKQPLPKKNHHPSVYMIQFWSDRHNLHGYNGFSVHALTTVYVIQFWSDRHHLHGYNGFNVHALTTV